MLSGLGARAAVAARQPAACCVKAVPRTGAVVRPWINNQHVRQARHVPSLRPGPGQAPPLFSEPSQQPHASRLSPRPVNCTHAGSDSGIGLFLGQEDLMRSHPVALSDDDEGRSCSDEDCAFVPSSTKASSRAAFATRSAGGSRPQQAKKSKAFKDKTAAKARRRPSSSYIPPPDTLSKEQKHAFDLAVNKGRSVYITGKAGTGKTFLLNAIIAGLHQKYGSDFASLVAVSAMTGLAATHIKGVTLHSTVGLRHVKYAKDFDSIRYKRGLRLRQVLLVDEVSMKSAEFLEMLDNKLREVMRCSKPFGGLQIIFCGDFCQLPPIETVETEDPGASTNFTEKEGYEPFLNRGWAFQSPVWSESELEHVLLLEVYRQKDPEFVKYLQALREGGEQGEEALQQLYTLCSRSLPAEVNATKLFTRTEDVNDCNTAALSQLTGATKVFKATDSVQVDAEILEGSEEYRKVEKNLWSSSFFRDCQAGDVLELKVGAQVMLLRNLDTKNELVNGSVGKVTAWSFDGKGRLVPEVRFNNGMTCIIKYHKYDCEFPDGVCIRRQIPLKLAWALTIHKSQGMTLDNVQVCLEKVFNDAMVYVAISRAKSMAGLQILSLPNKSNPERREGPSAHWVKGFYVALEKGTHKEYLSQVHQEWEWMKLLEAGGGADGSDEGKSGADYNDPVGNGWYWPSR